MSTKNATVHFIEVLDDGYNVTCGGKTRAVESRETVNRAIAESLMSMLQYLERPSTHNLSIEIRVEINIPEHSPERMID